MCVLTYPFNSKQQNNNLNSQDGDCEERSHPAGDECCVLWVCRDPDPGPATQLPTPSCDPASCGDHGSCDPATAGCSCDPGYTRGSSGACEQLADWDPEDNIRLLQITATSIQVSCDWSTLATVLTSDWSRSSSRTSRAATSCTSRPSGWRTRGEFGATILRAVTPSFWRDLERPWMNQIT